LVVASAFHEEQREPLAAATRAWNADVAGLVREVNADLDADAAAERLTALVEGLSERWHSGTLSLQRARELLTGALDREL
jgi:hypothetical protein